jgi:D-alanyl-D-alanine carboxypeptidase
VLTAAVTAAGVLGGTPELAAAPTPTPTPSASASPTPSAGSGAALSRVADRVTKALRGNTARHARYKITISGLGAIAHQPNKSSAPASNEKLLPAIALVEQVGAEYRYTTQVSGSAEPVDGVLHGDLVLVGSGDPTLTSRNLARLARHLRATGLRRVTGRLVVDDSRYGHRTRAPGWKHEFLPNESGAVDAFSVNNDNWRRDAAFLANPTNANAGLWRAALKKAGIRVSGTTFIGAGPSTSFPLVAHQSRPLSRIVRMTLRQSINFYSEMMLRELGYQTTGHGTRKSGVRAIRRFARSLSLPTGRVVDGSGLSYNNRETPGTFIAWLAKLPTLPPAYRVTYDGLAVSCRDDGTLKYRLCGKHVKHKVHAKTGTLTHITSLSGYTETEGRRFVTFSFLFSGVRSISAANRHIDDAITAVVRSRA